MKWTPGIALIALVVILMATLAAFAALRSTARGSAPAATVQLGLTGSENAAAALAAGAAYALSTYATVQVDTPPRPARGWPFQQLPLVAKMEFPAPPVPTIEISYVPPPFVIERIPVPPLAPPPGLPGVPAEGPSPLWLLLPLAAGAAFGDVDADTGPDTEVPPTPVIPEPGTLLLMGTGLAGIAGGAYRRKRRDATGVTRG